MNTTDPVADALTKIRNASRAKHPTVDVAASKLTERVLAILKNEGFIRNIKPVGEGLRRTLRVYLKYSQDKTPAIAELVRASRPGCRRYAGTESIPKVLNGIGRSIVSTSKGIMTDQEARKQRVGGEVMCYVW